MTSKAEKKRRKIADRKKGPYLPPFEVGQAIRQAEVDKRRAREQARRDEEDEHRFSRTPKQEQAWDWFYRLAISGASGAKEQVKAVRAQLTMEEFAVMAEDVRRTEDAASRRVAYRIGHSSTVTHDLRMSALRKLVIYRSFNGLDEAA